MDDENNRMWDEIRSMSEMLPQDLVYNANINVYERTQFYQVQNALKPTPDLPRQW